MRKPVFLLTVLVFFNTYLLAQNSMTGDGFGGRGWYKAHNYQVGAYSAFTVCGSDSQLYGWGSNNGFELGIGLAPSTTSPVAAAGMTNVKFYSTGYKMVAIKSDNTAWIWSDNFANSPQQVLSNVKFADAAIDRITFVKYDSTVWEVNLSSTGTMTAPALLPGINNAVRAIAVGVQPYTATIVLLSDGSVKIKDGAGRFIATNSGVPQTIPGLSNIVDIKGNTFSAFALDTGGNLFAFGSDAFFVWETGQSECFTLGLGGTFTGNITPPTKVAFPNGSAPIVAISANTDGQSALALDSNHKVYGWGWNREGQISAGNLLTTITPVEVATGVIDIYAGESFSCILKSDFTLWATGRSGRNDGSDWGSIWMNLPNIQRNVFTQINPTIEPMNLCAPRVWGVLPIKLSNFNCIANGNNAILNWQSAEEMNAAKYIVQYSNDGSSFTNIATVVATGSNSKYSYTQQQVSGTAFYRLKMMDKDGSFTYSEIRVVKFDNKAGFTIAPNPANSVVYLFTKNNAAIKSIQIVSVDGLVVKAFNNYSNGQGIDISHLAKGSYILKAIYKNNEMAFGKFLKI